MGGGRGTRLYPLTKERCKPAVPLAGKYRIVDIPISNCLNSGINRIFLLTQFNTASLHRHVQNTYNFDTFGGGFVDILSAEQTEKTTDWYQGTADAVRRNLTHFRNYPHDLVLVLSGDQLYRMDFREIIEQHIRTAADVTLAAIALPTSAVEGLGLMRVNDDLSIDSFVEKPKDPSSTLASTACYLFSGEAMHCLQSYVSEGNPTDAAGHFVAWLCKRLPVFGFQFGGLWFDIGSKETYAEADAAFWKLRGGKPKA